MSKIVGRSQSQIAASAPTDGAVFSSKKKGNYRNAELLAKVRELPCVHCGAWPVQACHSNRLIHGKGKGIKASDAAIMALCATEHAQLDNGTKYGRQELETLTDAYICKTYAGLEMLGFVRIPSDVWRLHGNGEIALELIARMESGELQNKL